MRAIRPIRVLVLALAAALLPALTVVGHHNPQVNQALDVAAGQGMTCNFSGAEWDCNGYGPAQTYRTAVVTPGLGPLEKVSTTSPALVTRAGFQMDANDQNWHVVMQDVGCDDAPSVTAFVKQVAALSTPDTSVSARLAECSLVGGLKTAIGTTATYLYWIDGTTTAAAFATPTPSPTAKPTATPTARPSPTPTPKPTASPTSTPHGTATGLPTPSPRATATATATAASGATATATATATALASGSSSLPGSATGTPATPAPTPEQRVAGITFTPEPTPAPPGAASGGGDGWVNSVPSPGDVSTDPAKLGISALAALGVLLFMGFIGELFDNTLQNNYPRMEAWWKQSRLGRIGRAFARIFRGAA